MTDNTRPEERDVHQMDVDVEQVEEEDRSADGSSSSPHVVSSPENQDDGLTNTPHSVAIPNRVFVGGIGCEVNESDLHHVFSQRGAVREVKIVTDRLGISMGYGFVTFESQDDALKILHDASGIYVKDKQLSIAQAYRRQPASGQMRCTPVPSPAPVMPLHATYGTPYQTPSTGHTYTYHNGAAYFHCPNVNPHHYIWPPAPPVMPPQPVYQHPAHQHHQCVPNPYHWNVIQSPWRSGPVAFSQLHQCADGGSVQPPQPLREETSSEFTEPTVPQVYSRNPRRTEERTPFFLQHGRGRNQRFPHPNVRTKPKYHQYVDHKDCQLQPEVTEPPDPSQPLM